MEMNPISSRIKIAASQHIKERDYWLNQLSGDLVKSFFPYDHNELNPGQRSMETIDFYCPGDLSAKLLKLANNSDNRLHMILTAGLVLLLHKYTGNSDILLGMPIYKQEKEGDFLNWVLPLRNTLEEGMTFRGLLLQVRETIQAAVEHQNYPMEALGYKLNLSSSGTGMTLFDVVILLEKIHDKTYLKQFDYNMLFSLRRGEQGLEGTLEYNAALYEKGTGLRIVNHFQQALEKVLADPDIPPAAVEIMTGEERRQILQEFNSPAGDDENRRTIHEWWEIQVEKTPHHIALIYREHYLGYRELNRAANQWAGLLRGKGVKKESIVGILLEPSLEMIMGILAVLKAGGCCLPIDTQYPPKRIFSLLRDSSAVLLLSKENVIDALSITSLIGTTRHQVTPVVTPPRPAVEDFDRLPFPDRTLVNYEKYHANIGIAMVMHSVLLQATRGCPYNCVFCHKIWPKKHVARSAENIFQEIDACLKAGVRRFVFIDDVFNLNRDNLCRFMEKIIKNRLGLQLFFPNGLRGDILTEEIIDIMVEAGTINITLALETASPRIQRLIKKNLDLEKFKSIALYIAKKYPWVLFEMELMIGFPTETEEDVQMTMEFLESIKWVHFPNLHILKIYPNTDMYRLAVANGVSPERIARSTHQAFHQLPETLPFSKRFAGQIQGRFMNDYFLARERLLQVLPHQCKTLTRSELVQKYNSYLPMKIESFADILKAAGISPGEMAFQEFLPEDHMSAPRFLQNLASDTQRDIPQDPSTLRILLLDLSLAFSFQGEKVLYDMIEEPLGLMYLLTYLNKTYPGKIQGKIGKSRVDFDSYAQLRIFIREFRPDLIGIRTLSFYKDFFHKTVSLIRQWGYTVPIITGGPYATSDYTLILNDPYVDAVVLGEGELTFAHLVQEILANGKKWPADDRLLTIPGIAFMKQDDKSHLKAVGREILFMDYTADLAAAYPAENPVHINQPGDLLYLISTSGSTGVPKSLMMEHQNLANLLHFQFNRTGIVFRRVLQFASIGFDVSIQEIFSALLQGGELYLIDSLTKQDISRLLALLTKNYIDIVFWPPAFVKYIFSEPALRAGIPKTLRHIITAGEPLQVNESLAGYLRENRVTLHNHYGPAETHVVTTYTIEPTGIIPGLPPIGRPISNTLVFILDEQRKLKPIGMVGELYIGGAGVGRGYLDRPELTAEKFIVIYKPDKSDKSDRSDRSDLSDLSDFSDLSDGFFRSYRSYWSHKTYLKLYKTGDLACWLPGGDIQYKGRVDHQVKIRGYRIELGEIENRLLKNPGVKEAVVMITQPRVAARQDDDKYLCAYIVSARADWYVDGGAAAEELKTFLSAEMPDYMIPAYYIILERIPLTSTGKINRRELPVPEIKPVRTYEPPRDNLEKRLTEIWAEVLGMQKEIIGIQDDFFHLGGHSLKATIMAAKFREEMKIEVPLLDIFRRPTIQLQAEYLNERSRAGTSFTAVSGDDQLVPLNPGNPDAHNLFLIHDGVGEVEGYLEFCRLITAGIHCWGLRAPRREDLAPRKLTIPDAAREYVQRIKQLQPTGPYLIAGWSLGGTIAFEMASQLEQAGEEIGILALIDTLPPQQKLLPGTTAAFDLASELAFIGTYAPGSEIEEKLKKETSVNRLWELAVEHLEKNPGNIQLIKKEINAYGIHAIPNFQQLGLRETVYFLNVARTLDQARTSYIPGGKMKTPLYFFKASQSAFNDRTWEYYCKNEIIVHNIDGDHYSILRPPQVIPFANVFNGIIKTLKSRRSKDDPFFIKNL